MMWLTATALVFGLQDGGAVDLTTRFLALLPSQPEAAATMLDPQGMIAVHHIGGALTLENLGFPDLGCVARGAPRLDERNPPADGGVLVLTDWLCPVPGEERLGRPLTVRFFVREQQIAAVYLEFAETTAPWPSSE